jgi:ABC-2 type transport system ATP-binding protein
MEEADALCSRLAIVDHGRIVACDTPEALKASLGGDAVSLEVEAPRAEDDGELRDRLEALPFVSAITGSDGTLELAAESPERHVPDLVDTARAAGARITSLRFRKPTLEDVFLHFTGRTIRDAERSADARSIGRAQRRR